MNRLQLIGFGALALTSLGGCPSPVTTYDAATTDAPSRADAGPLTDAPSPSDAWGPDAPGAAQVSMSAVSVLFPLPTAPSLEGLLALDAAGRGGPLLPRALFDAIPVFDGGRGGAYETWRIIGARIDPCFPTHALLTTNPSMCRRQLRLIAQPSVQDGGVSGPSDDNAIHLLYDLTEAQFNDLAARWVAPLVNEPGARTQALDVSPRMRSEGLRGAYATTIRNLILEFAGQETLGQATFMLGQGVAWQFGGFRILSGTRTDLEIPGLRPAAGTTESSFLQITISDVDAPFSFAPVSDATEGLMPLAGALNGGGIGDHSWSFMGPASLRTAAMQLSFDIEDPHGRFTPDTVDCSSCHAAGHARHRAIRGGQTSEGLTHYTHPTRPLTVPTGAANDRLDVQRAFGYLQQQPAVNQRTVNESAEVADWVERFLTR